MTQENSNLDFDLFTSTKILPTKEELLSLDRKNKSCHAGRELARIKSTKEHICEEMESLQNGWNLLSSVEDFLQVYQEALSASEDALNDEPWFPLMSMLLKLLKGFKSIVDVDLREGLEAEAMDIFLSQAREMGYVLSNGGEDE